LCVLSLCRTFLVGLFITNDQLGDSISGFTKEVDGYLEDGESFIGFTKDQINAVMVTSYGDLADLMIEEACPGGMEIPKYV